MFLWQPVKESLVFGEHSGLKRSAFSFKVKLMLYSNLKLFRYLDQLLNPQMYKGVDASPLRFFSNVFKSIFIVSTCHLQAVCLFLRHILTKFGENQLLQG